MSLFSKNRKKPYKTAEVGKWLFEWYYNEKNILDCYLLIKAKNGIFSVKINGVHHVYGYLLAALEQNDTTQLHGYIAMLYVASTTLTQDQGFVDDMNKAIAKYLKRLDKKATNAAKSVKDHEESANQALMKDVVSELSLSDKELKAKREAERLMMKQIMNESAE